MLRVFPDMASHNVRRLHEAGLCVTVNSDNPPYFGGYINENFDAIHAGLGFSDVRNGLFSANPSVCTTAIWSILVSIGHC
jgi:adenosine deaminase